MQTIQRSQDKLLEVEFTKCYSSQSKKEHGYFSSSGLLDFNTREMTNGHSRDLPFIDRLHHIYELLAPCTGRIVSLHANNPVSPQHFRAGRVNFEQFFSSNSWPVLRSFSYIHGSGWRSINLPLTSDRFPSIIYVRLYSMDLSTPLSRSIIELHLSHCGHNLVRWAYFGELQHLERLFIDDSCLPHQSESLDEELQLHGPSSNLLNLQVLVIENVDWRDLCLLLGFLRTPNLRDLVIHLGVHFDSLSNWNPEFSGIAWLEVRLPQLCSLELRNTAVIQDDLVSLLTHLPSSLTHLMLRGDQEGFNPSGEDTLRMVLRPELARLRCNLTHIEFFNIRAPDVVSLVRDGGCASLTSIVLDLQPPTFPSLGISKYSAECSTVIGVLRELEGVEVEFRARGEHREPRAVLEAQTRYADKGDWRERFSDDFWRTQRWGILQSASSENGIQSSGLYREKERLRMLFILILLVLLVFLILLYCL